MMFTVGNLLDPKDETDEAIFDFTAAYDQMIRRAEETENLVVGLYEDESDYAKFIAVNGEVFKAI